MATSFSLINYCRNRLVLARQPFPCQKYFIVNNIDDLLGKGDFLKYLRGKTDRGRIKVLGSKLCTWQANGSGCPTAIKTWWSRAKETDIIFVEF
jgi:hypothetical protein